MGTLWWTGCGMRLPYCAIMRSEKHAIGCTHTHTQHEWPVPQKPTGRAPDPPRKDISIGARNLHTSHALSAFSRLNSTK